MMVGYHPLVKRLLDGELSLRDLPPELRAEGEEALRTIGAVDRSPVAFSPALDARVMALVRRHARSPARRALSQPHAMCSCASGCVPGRRWLAPSPWPRRSRCSSLRALSPLPRPAAVLTIPCSCDSCCTPRGPGRSRSPAHSTSGTAMPLRSFGRGRRGCGPPPSRCRSVSTATRSSWTASVGCRIPPPPRWTTGSVVATAWWP